MDAGEDIFADIEESSSSESEEEDEEELPRRTERRSPVVWSAEENRLFLVGLRKYGRSKWKEIAALIKTKYDSVPCCLIFLSYQTNV